MMNRSCEAIVSTGLMLSLIVVALPGCGVRPATGGTKGVLRTGAEALGDIQLTVHQMDSGVWRQVGFGITGPDGEFELLAPGAEGPLWLTPGEYRCTLESVGAPVQIPKECSQAETTPLKITWTETDDALTLEVEGVAP